MKWNRTATSLVAFCGAALAAFGSVVGYSYDGDGRLSSANYASVTNLSYAYDPAGNLLLAAGPTPALLVDHASASHITLRWPMTPTGYALERAPALAVPTTWATYTVSSNQVGSFWVATVPAAGTSYFYRLRYAP